VSVIPLRSAAFGVLMTASLADAFLRAVGAGVLD
jgi:hypothetical protein